jgi:hypothetical protein
MQCPTELLSSYVKNIFQYVRQRTERAVCEVENVRYDKWRPEPPGHLHLGDAVGADGPENPVARRIREVVAPQPSNFNQEGKGTS